MKNPSAIQNPSQYGEEILRKELAEAIGLIRQLKSLLPAEAIPISLDYSVFKLLARHKPSEEA